MLIGHMIQGDWIQDDGTISQPVSVFFNLLRLWDSRAVWHKMETDTLALNANIKFAQSRNAKVMFTFGEPPESVLLAGYKKVPTKEAWIAFVNQIAATPNIDIFEGWNEPMYPQYWDGSMEQLVDYQRIMYQILKPLGKIVLSPSFVRVELPDGKAFLQSFKDAGGFQWCDGVAWHGYAEKPEDLRGQHESLRIFTDLDLYNTEYVIGPTTSLAQMQQYIIDSLLLLNALKVKCAVWDAEVSEDYNDPTMKKVFDMLSTPTKVTGKGGCLLFFLPWVGGI